jgi:uroporphyrinogen decarboxylase
MTKRERVLAAIAGVAVDRVPYSFWYHFPGGDRADEAFVRNEVEFALRFDVDLLKVMHDAPFDLPGGASHAETVEAFSEIPAIDPRAGHFGLHLAALAAIRERLPDDRPMVDTLFDVYAYAERITDQRLAEFIAADREAARRGLESVAESLVRWTDCCLEVVDGIFLACGASSVGVMDARDLGQLIHPLDCRVLEAAAARGTTNVVHVHGPGALHFDEVAAMPSHIVNWSDRTTNVSLAEGRRRIPGRCLAGGINEVTAGGATPERIAAEVDDAIAQLGARGMIVACGCAVSTETPAATLDAIGEAVRRRAAQEGS